MNITVSEKTINDSVAALRAHIEANKTGVDFCKLWPGAKQVLQLIGQALGGYAVILINILISIGDAYAAKHCAT